MIGPTAFTFLFILLSINPCLIALLVHPPCSSSFVSSEASPYIARLHIQNSNPYRSTGATGAAAYPYIEVQSSGAMAPKRRARSDTRVAPEGAAVDVLVAAAIKAAFKAKLRRGGWNYDALDIECSKYEHIGIQTF